MLHVRVADRADDLLDELVRELSTPLPDPFQAEWVSVPSLGFRTWLTHRLAERLGAPHHSGAGVVANVELPFPGSLRWRLLRAHGARTGHGDPTDPWQVERLVWSVLDVMADPAADVSPRLRRSELPAGATLASRAGPVADLFDRYGVHRPEMVRAWSRGRDVGAGGQPLTVDRRWQPELYRAVARHVAARHQGLPPPAERLAEALELVTTGALDLAAPLGPTDRGLPPRLFVVGQSTLTAELGPVLTAVAAQAEVHLLVLAPSGLQALAAAEAAARHAPAAPAGPVSWAFPRALAPTSAADGDAHPLLAVWGRRPLESALLLGAGGVVPTLVPGSPARRAGSSLLHRIQTELRQGAPPAGTFRQAVADGSFQVHAAPGRARQVEVLRDVVLGLLRDDPTLRESDIAVVCPRLEDYATVISSVLGPPARRGEQPEPDCVPALRYAVVDRDARSFNPVLAAMQAVVDVVPSRYDVAGVRDLLHAPAVRARFGLTDDDLGLFSEWVEATGVRWGLDGPHRQPWHIDASHAANSWEAGIHQLMAGVALGDPLRLAAGDGHDPRPSPHALTVGGFAPLDLPEGAIGSAGRLAAAVRTLAHVHHLLADAPIAPPGQAAPDPADDGEVSGRPVAAWRDLLATAADLLVAPAPFEDWQRAAFDDALAGLVAASADHRGRPSTTLLTFGDVRRLLAPALLGPRARADLGFGSVVVARPTLLAGVPFRVVCVLGLDDDAMPAAFGAGDDLLTLHPFVGDREARSEARAEILAALLAAQDTLVITCTSRDVRTNETVPRSVLLDELLDLVAATVAADAPIPPGRDPREAVVRNHPRQAFDLTNFVDPSAPGPFGFDPTARDGARAVASRRAGTGRPPPVHLLLTEPLPPPPDEDGEEVVVDLAELRAFYDHPVRHFFRNRLRITIPRARDDIDSQLPTTVAKLEAAGIGRDLIAIGMALDDPADIGLTGPGFEPRHPEVAALLASYRARGVLPPAAVAGPELAAVSEEVEAMLRLAGELDVLREADTAHRVDIELAGGTRLHGTVAGCCTGAAPGPLHVRYARFKPRYLVGLSIDLLALAAHGDHDPWRGVLLARGAAGKPPVRHVRQVRGDDAAARRRHALDALDVLVNQYRAGRRYPLPLFDATSHALVHEPKKAANSWGTFPKGPWSYNHECHDLHHQLAFGTIDFDTLTDLDAGGHRMHDEARRLWGTLDRALDPVEVDPQRDIGSTRTGEGHR